jgi:PPOX class probable F420-dependent enzyme
LAWIPVAVAGSRDKGGWLTVGSLVRQRGFVPWERVDFTLRASRTLWLSTTRPDGRPHSVPVWFTWDGERLHFATGDPSQKARNLRHQPWVVLDSGDGDNALIVEGTAELVSDKGELSTVDRARGEKYVEPRTGARDTILVPDTLVYRVRIEHVMAWMYGDMVTRTDWVPA